MKRKLRFKTENITNGLNENYFKTDSEIIYK